MWRPFVSDLVTNSYSEYRKKMDRIWSTKPKKSEEKPAKFSVKHLFPNSDLEKEIEKRHKEFISLQRKVLEQRKSIREKDKEQLLFKTQKFFTQKQKSEQVKAKIKKQRLLIRSMASNKPSDFNKTLTFKHRTSSFGQTLNSSPMYKYRKYSSS